MANMKEAVVAAADFVGSLYPDARDIRLEEIAAQGKLWHVVVSFASARDNPLAHLVGPPSSRTFKEVEVQRDSGEPISLRMWQA